MASTAQGESRRNRRSTVAGSATTSAVVARVNRREEAQCCHFVSATQRVSGRKKRSERRYHYTATAAAHAAIHDAPSAASSPTSSIILPRQAPALRLYSEKHVLGVAVARHRIHGSEALPLRCSPELSVLLPFGTTACMLVARDSGSPLTTWQLNSRRHCAVERKSPQCQRRKPLLSIVRRLAYSQTFSAHRKNR
jgi:hypothetical protein